MSVATAVVKKKRGRTRKAVQPVDVEDKENVDPTTETSEGRKKAKHCAGTV